MANPGNKRGETDRTAQTTGKQGRIRRTGSCIWQVLFEGKSVVWTALFTGILAIFTYLLYRVTDGADKTTRSIQRAFVYSARVDMNTSVPGDPADYVGVHIENSGATPARAVRSDANVCVKEGWLPEDFSYPAFIKILPPSSMIPPRGEFVMYSPILKRDTYLVSERRKQLFVWGTITYKDIFGEQHVTQYCWRFSGGQRAQDTDNRFVGVIFEQCAKHYCDDEDCPQRWGTNDDAASCPAHVSAPPSPPIPPQPTPQQNK